MNTSDDVVPELYKTIQIVENRLQQIILPDQPNIQDIYKALCRTLEELEQEGLITSTNIDWRTNYKIDISVGTVPKTLKVVIKITVR